jgi:hypothetical protein
MIGDSNIQYFTHQNLYRNIKLNKWAIIFYIVAPEKVLDWISQSGAHLSAQ